MFLAEVVVVLVGVVVGVVVVEIENSSSTVIYRIT